MEQEVYDKYACWCEETTARKAHAIEEGRKAVTRLGNQVLEFKGKIARRRARPSRPSEPRWARRSTLWSVQSRCSAT